MRCWDRDFGQLFLTLYVINIYLTSNLYLTGQVDLKGGNMNLDPLLKKIFEPWLGMNKKVIVGLVV